MMSEISKPGQQQVEKIRTLIAAITSTDRVLIVQILIIQTLKTRRSRSPIENKMQESRNNGEKMARDSLKTHLNQQMLSECHLLERRRASPASKSF